MYVYYIKRCLLYRTCTEEGTTWLCIPKKEHLSSTSARVSELHSSHRGMVEHRRWAFFTRLPIEDDMQLCSPAGRHPLARRLGGANECAVQKSCVKAMPDHRCCFTAHPLASGEFIRVDGGGACSDGVERAPRGLESFGGRADRGGRVGFVETGRMGRFFNLLGCCFYRSRTVTSYDEDEVFDRFRCFCVAGRC